MIIVVHGGAGSPSSLNDGCVKAAEAGFDALKQGKSALEAAMAAVVVMEDDGRFNAGSGSILRLDGRSIEMDATVMDSTGVLGSVAVVSGVKNPVLLAREVARSPHIVLSGQGAVAFARSCGFPEYVHVSDSARAKYKKAMEALKRRDAEDLGKAFVEFDLRKHWNFETPYEEAFPTDTVGAVAVDSEGRYAVASSTGGSSLMLRGRIGDVPFIGCGYYAGEAGAVATTGTGEEIIRRMMARAVYDRLRYGPQKACERGVALFPHRVPVGAIAVSKGGYGVAANRDMAWHAIEG